MKKQLTITTVGVLALGAMLLGLSCSPPAQNNTNTGLGNNAATINSNLSAKSGSVAPEKDPCTDPDKPGAVAKQLEDDMKANDKLNKQFEKKSFRFRIYPGLEPNSLYLFFAGAIGGPDALGDLAAIIKKVGKKACVERVFFATSGTIPSSADAVRTTSERFFEWWITCQDPNIPCLGECKPADQCTAAVIPGANANVNANANTNANKTSTTNSSSNSNSRPAANRQ